MRAADAIESGDVAIVATDTVYGLAALPRSAGYDKIFVLKKRPASQALPLLITSQMFGKLTQDLPPYAALVAQTFWPGALTLIVKASVLARKTCNVADEGTLALRCPDDGGCLSLCERFCSPIACTSANLHGQPAPFEKDAIDTPFRILPGFSELPVRCAGGLSSTIVDCTAASLRIVREGPIPTKVIMELACFGDTVH